MLQPRTCLGMALCLLVFTGCEPSGPPADPAPASPDTDSGATGDAADTGAPPGDAASDAGNVVTEPGAPQLGTGDGSPESVVLRIIAGDKWLDEPTDLAFNPARPDELWITNRNSDSFTVVTGPGTGAPSFLVLTDHTQHFAEEVTAIAFSDEHTFATCGETNNTYGGMVEGDYFMGPAQWSDDVGLFKKQASHPGGAHLDMLHSSPWCMGIAWSGGATYYAFNGYLGAIDWYDFGEPHEPGGEDHSDGKKLRLAKDLVERVPGVPSHMEYDSATGWLYVADTGNARVIRLDTQSGTVGKLLFSNKDPGTTLYEVDGIVVEEVVPAFAGLLGQPSGLALHDGKLFVSDHGTGHILAFDLEGELLGELDTGRGQGALGGLAFDDAGLLYFTDIARDEVVRIEP